MRSDLLKWFHMHVVASPPFRMQGTAPAPFLQLPLPLTACSDAGRAPTVGGHVTWAGKLGRVVHACVCPTWAVVALPAISTSAISTKLARGAVALARCCVDQQGVEAVVALVPARCGVVHAAGWGTASGALSVDLLQAAGVHSCGGVCGVRGKEG